MSTLLVGFDSAWTATNCGAVAAAFCSDDGVLQGLGPPRIADFPDAADLILQWQAQLLPTRTIIFLDEPTIVRNPTGQRPVEQIVCPSVGRRYGGMQPANTSRREMFGDGAPVWPFLERFGGATDPLGARSAGSQVFETYPVLTMIALGWLLPDARATGRLPKYNPGRRKTFLLAAWRYLCDRLSEFFQERGLTEIFQWITAAGQNPSPRKSEQDGLDACLCLLVALYSSEGADCLMVGDLQTGYILVPDSAELRREIEERCDAIGRDPAQWVRTIRLAEMCA